MIAAVARLIPMVLVATAGVGVVAVGTRWRHKQVKMAQRKLMVGLTHPSVSLRKEAIRVATGMGLARTAEQLLHVATWEEDPDVQAALASAIASRQWEPVSTPHAVTLRRWAQTYSDGTVAAPSRVVVSGAGGPAGVAVIRELRRRGHHVIAVDTDPAAAGLRLADEGHVIRPATDRLFGVELAGLAGEAGAEALLCTVAEQLEATDQTLLEAMGVRTLLPPPEAVLRCLDRWAFARTMADYRLSSPATALGEAAGVPAPWAVKSRFGAGSRGVTFADTKVDLGRALRWTPDPIVQTRVTGRGFTVDALIDPTGSVAGLVPRWRLETKEGISTRGETFSDPDVEDVAGLTLKVIGLVGPATVHGFVTDEAEVVIVGVSPTFSAGLPLSLHAGADLVGEYLRAVLGQAIRPDRLTFRTGATMVRHYEELFSG